MSNSAQESFTPKKGRIVAALIIVALFVIGILQVLGGSSGFVTAQVDDVHLGVSGTYGDAVFIKLADITDIQLTDSFDFGSCIEGGNTENTVSGLYSCNAYERYTVHAYTAISSCIVITHKDGVLVFNCASDSLTEDLYDQLMQAAG